MLGWQAATGVVSEWGEVPAAQAQTYAEGAVRRVYVNAYERNQAARAACLDHYGHTCQVCKTDLTQVYGEVARGYGYLQVHHLRPLADLQREYEVEPVKDLLPVCPNCHAMLHRRSPPYTPEELQQLMGQ